MREQNRKATGKAMIVMTDDSIQTRGDCESMKKTALHQAGAADTATALISFIHTGFRKDDIDRNQGIFPPANPTRRPVAFPQTVCLALTGRLASHGTARRLPPARPICKMGNAAGSQGRFGKKFHGTRLDLPCGPAAVRQPSGTRIAQVAAMRAVATTIAGPAGRRHAENRLAIELQNATRMIPPSGEREEQQ